MIPVARRAATAALAGAALTLVCCSTARADEVTVTTTAPTTTTGAPATTSTTTPPVTTPKPRQIVRIGTAESVQASGSVQPLDVGPVQAVGANGARSELPHTGATSAWLALLGFALVLLGALGTRGQHPQLRLSARS